MQSSRVLVSTALWLVAVSNAMAASSVDLRVAGKITPSACTPTLSNGGVVDHGKISVQDLDPTSFTVLPEGGVQLSVTCDAPTLMAIKPSDNRPGTAAGDFASPSVFGLGLASGDKKIGWYTLTMKEITADDIVAAPIESVDGSVWFEAYNAIWQPGWMRSVKDPANATPTPLTLTTFKGTVVVAATIARKRNLPVAEEIQIDGSATLDVIYL